MKAENAKHCCETVGWIVVVAATVAMAVFVWGIKPPPSFAADLRTKALNVAIESAWLQPYLEELNTHFAVEGQLSWQSDDYTHIEPLMRLHDALKALGFQVEVINHSSLRVH